MEDQAQEDGRLITGVILKQFHSELVCFHAGIRKP